MGNFYEYSPEQGYLLPPNVREVLGEEHLCFYIHRAVERLDLSGFEQDYSEEGHPAYHPALMLKVWLYAYALGVTSSRRLEQRIREDLAFRYLAGGAQPDFWALNDFRTWHKARHQRRVHTGGGAGVLRWGWRDWGTWRLIRPIAANAAGGFDREHAAVAERAQIRKRIRRCSGSARRKIPMKERE